MSEAPIKCPRVSWEEARDHIVMRLFIDDEAVLHFDKGFHWWPGFLRLDVYVAHEGEYVEDSQDNWLQLVGETKLAEVVDTDLGVSLADQINGVFVHGAAIYRDGNLLLRTAYVFNSLNRGLMKVFHEQLLAQITLAHEFATQWGQLPGVEICLSSHPKSGKRSGPDELLNIYWGDGVSETPEYVNFNEGVAIARNMIPNIMIDQGWDQGYESEEVSFFTSGAVSVGMGVLPESWLNLKYGLGIFVVANELNFQNSLTPAGANLLNSLVSDLEQCSQFGPFLSETHSSGQTTTMPAFIPRGAMAEDRMRPGDLALTITNFAIHLGASCAGAFALLSSQISSTNDHEESADA